MRKENQLTLKKKKISLIFFFVLSIHLSNQGKDSNQSHKTFKILLYLLDLKLSLRSTWNIVPEMYEDFSPIIYLPKNPIC